MKYALSSTYYTPLNQTTIAIFVYKNGTWNNIYDPDDLWTRKITFPIETHWLFQRFLNEDEFKQLILEEL